MTNTRSHRLISLAVMSALASLSAHAQSGHDAYYYGGLSVGESQSHFNNDRIANTVLGGTPAISGIQEDNKDTAYKLFGGYQFNRNFGLEMGYFNLGKFNFTSQTAPTGTLDGHIRVQGVNLDLVGTLPLYDRFALIGRVGAQYAKTNDAFDGTGAASGGTGSTRGHQTHIKAGAGFQFEVNPSFLIRTELERYRANDGVGEHGAVNMVSVSLVMPFGRTPQSAPRVAMAPAYVEPVATAEPMPAPMMAPAPEPMAVAVVAPMPVSLQKVSFSAESLFAFDRAVVKPEGRGALDKFMSDMSGTQYDVIHVEGHADRLGSDAYNQKLSMERAESVKTYLVSGGVIDASKVSAEGKSESQPVTKPGECSNKLKRAALITCLQPDRRVDIDVVGLR